MAKLEEIKKKAGKVIKVVAVEAKEFAKSFAFGYCAAAGIGVTMLFIEAKRKDSHLEWHPNK